MTEGQALARAALAGNPSDIYGGAVLGVTIHGLAATARLGPAVSSARSATHDPAAAEVTDGAPIAPNLVHATLARFDREFATASAATDARVKVSTEIPRSVGLGGSSAIVIALLRALCAEHAVAVELDDLAELALSIERDDLGIAAGLQDRVTQCYEGVVFMDFAAGRYERLDPRGLPPLLVAWRTRTASPSGQVHGNLRARWEAEEPLVLASVAELAALARRAKDAVSAGDHDELRLCVDGSFDARARMLELNPQHVEMVQVAREAGAAANYAGSGGAIVCACRDVTHRLSVASKLRAAHCATWDIALDG